MLRLAIEKGSYRKGNRTVEAYDVRVVRRVDHVFFGPIVVMSRQVTCWYYSSKVFAVDFDRKLITDYAMDSYSISTSQNISGWRRAFREMFPEAVPEDATWLCRQWCAKGDDTAQRFSARVPWVRVDRSGVRWFHWPAYDDALALAYDESRAFLRTSQNWRYFVYDWTEDGSWEARFINDDARRRYEARERRKGQHGNVP